MKKSLMFVAVMLFALLAGCAAPVVVSSVTVFQSWKNDDIEKTYRMEASRGQANNLEFNNYAGLLDNQLQRFGFVLVDKDPAIKVRMTYGTSPRIISSWEPAPFSRPYYGPYGFRSWPSYGPDWQSVVDTAYTHRLEVTIVRVADGKNIYTVRSRLNSDSPELSLSMRYLIESAFQRFPGQNGVTETVSVPVR